MLILLECLVAFQNVFQLGYRGGTTSLGEPDPAPDLWRRNPVCGHEVGGEGEDVETWRTGGVETDEEMGDVQARHWDVSEALNTVRKWWVISVLPQQHSAIYQVTNKNQHVC